MPRKRSGLAEGVATVAPTKRTRKKMLDVAEEQRGRLWEAVSRKLERQATSLRKLGNPYA